MGFSIKKWLKDDDSDIFSNNGVSGEEFYNIKTEDFISGLKKGEKALQRKNRRDCEEFRMVGYAKKTSSLAESLQIVDSLKIKLSFNIDDWTYKSNDGTVSEFTTTSLQMRNQYALLDNLEGSGNLYNSLTFSLVKEFLIMNYGIC